MGERNVYWAILLAASITAIAVVAIILVIWAVPTSNIWTGLDVGYCDAGCVLGRMG